MAFVLNATSLNQKQFIRLLQEFGAKLVLEVFGGAGAIWGFSEAAGLRSSETIWFWRPLALTVGVIFSLRWMNQLHDYVRRETACTKERDAESLELIPKENEETKTCGYGSS